LPTPTGLGLTAGFAGTGLGQPVPEDEIQVKLSPDVLDPSLLTKASEAPERVVWNAVVAGAKACKGKFVEEVSPAT
jgi:hypothetical protein